MYVLVQAPAFWMNYRESHVRAQCAAVDTTRISCDMVDVKIELGLLAIEY